MMNPKHGDVQRGSPLRIVVWGTAAFVLLLPWIAMQFTSEVVWGFMDFIIFGTMLFVVCGSYEFITRMTGNRAYRLAVGIALMGAFFILWINLAVGIIGEPENSANLMYVGVLAVGIAAAAIARFQPRGLARALFAMALAQLLVAVITVLAGLGAPVTPPLSLLMMNGFFIALWTGSAWLFLKSGG